MRYGGRGPRWQRARILRGVSPTDSVSWNRAADLDRIRSTYAAYEAAGRGRLWDRGNRGYARLLRSLRDHLVKEIARALPATGGRVIDLGCGTGDLLDDVERFGLRPEWLGVDLRPEAIADAVRSHPSARFIVASADDVPEPPGSVDVIVAQLLFSSLPTDALEHAVAAEIRRLLRPGGRLVWCDLRFANPSNPEVHGVGSPALQELFPTWEARLRTVGLLPPIARRLGRSTAILYPVLSAFSPIRSHLVGRLESPGS